MMEHISLTQAQMDTANKAYNLLVFRDNAWYIYKRRPYGRKLLNSDGSLTPAPLPSINHQDVHSSINYRGFFTSDKLHSHVFRTRGGGHTPYSRHYYTQTYDAANFMLSECVDVGPAEYHTAMGIAILLPHISLLIEPETGFSTITVAIKRYDDNVVRWINTVIDQFNQLEAENEAKTA